VRYERDQGLRLIVEPFLITEKSKDDHHRRTHEMVIDIVPENTEFHQGSVDEIHKSLLCGMCTDFHRHESAQRKRTEYHGLALGIMGGILTARHLMDTRLRSGVLSV